MISVVCHCRTAPARCGVSIELAGVYSAELAWRVVMLAALRRCVVPRLSRCLIKALTDAPLWPRQRAGTLVDLVYSPQVHKLATCGDDGVHIVDMTDFKVRVWVVCCSSGVCLACSRIESACPVAWARVCSNLLESAVTAWCWLPLCSADALPCPLTLAPQFAGGQVRVQGVQADRGRRSGEARVDQGRADPHGERS